MDLIDVEGATGGIDTDLENIKKGIIDTSKVKIMILFLLM